MQGMADPWNRAPMAWNSADKAFCSAVQRLLQARRQSPLLQTGYLDVKVTGADTLIIRRIAKDGLDAFGNPLNDSDAEISITRQLLPFSSRG